MDLTRGMWSEVRWMTFTMKKLELISQEDREKLFVVIKRPW